MKCGFVKWGIIGKCLKGAKVYENIYIFYTYMGEAECGRYK